MMVYGRNGEGKGGRRRVREGMGGGGKGWRRDKMGEGIVVHWEGEGKAKVLAWNVKSTEIC